MPSKVAQDVAREFISRMQDPGVLYGLGQDEKYQVNPELETNDDLKEDTNGPKQSNR